MVTALSLVPGAAAESDSIIVNDYASAADQLGLDAGAGRCRRHRRGRLVHPDDDRLARTSPMATSWVACSAATSTTPTRARTGPGGRRSVADRRRRRGRGRPGNDSAAATSPSWATSMRTPSTGVTEDNVWADELEAGSGRHVYVWGDDPAEIDPERVTPVHDLGAGSWPFSTTPSCGPGNLGRSRTASPGRRVTTTASPTVTSSVLWPRRWTTPAPWGRSRAPTATPSTVPWCVGGRR